MNTKKIIKKRIIEKQEKVFDIEVKDSHHYFLENGVISHNSGGMYEATKQGGGCLIPGTKIYTFNNVLKSIEGVESGDYVKTLCGYKEVLETYTFEKSTIKIEFEDTTNIICSEDHRFLISGDYTIESNWKKAKDLANNENILKIENNNIFNLKIKNINHLYTQKVHDISVKDVHHYISETGIINHNSGNTYSASTILFLSKSSLKEDGQTKTGIVVRSKTQKNRLAKPIDIEFHISHISGMNPYVGLQDYISWENCGVVRGTLLTKKEFEKDKSNNQKTYHEFEHNNEKYYVIPSDKARNIVIRDGCKEVPFKKLFTSEVFTENVIKELDEKVIRPKFKYDKIKDLLSNELTEVFGDTTDDESDE